MYDLGAFAFASIDDDAFALAPDTSGGLVPNAAQPSSPDAQATTRPFPSNDDDVVVVRLLGNAASGARGAVTKRKPRRIARVEHVVVRTIRPLRRSMMGWNAANGGVRGESVSVALSVVTPYRGIFSKWKNLGFRKHDCLRYPHHTIAHARDVRRDRRGRWRVCCVTRVPDNLRGAYTRHIRA